MLYKSVDLFLYDNLRHVKRKKKVLKEILENNGFTLYISKERKEKGACYQLINEMWLNDREFYFK